MRPFRRAAAALLLLALAAGCRDGAAPERVPTPNFVALESEAGDTVGMGRSYRYTQADALLIVAALGGVFSVGVEGDEQWVGNFELPAGTTRLQPGTYAALARWPFNDPRVGGLAWGGEGRHCLQSVGALTIDTVAYEGSQLAALTFRFEQRCGTAAAPALRGTVHWRADDHTRPPGPTAAPAGLWQPPAGATPATGDYAYLQSDAGDRVGEGRTVTYLDAATPVQALGRGPLVEVVVGDWFGDFVAMASLDRLAPGYYGNAQRWPFHNVMRPGLSWATPGRGCNALAGWFMVDRIAWAGETLTALELRFEQRCDGGGAALRGKLRWSA